MLAGLAREHFGWKLFINDKMRARELRTYPAVKRAFTQHAAMFA
jgi:hypothetical protein